MSEEGTRDARVYYTRSEVELELGRLVLSLGRLQATAKRDPRRGARGPQPAVSLFLETSTRLIAHTHSRQRRVLLQRLVEIAASAELGLIGLEEWLHDQAPATATSGSRMAVQVSWQGEAGSTRSSGRI